MIERKSDHVAWEIPNLGWRNTELVTTKLKEFRMLARDHMFEMSPFDYVMAMEKNILEYEVKPLQGYCAFYLTRQVQMDMCLLTMDIQRMNMKYDVVVGLKYSFGKSEVTLYGSAMKLKD